MSDLREYYRMRISNFERDMTWLMELAVLFLVQLPVFVYLFMEKKEIAPLVYIAFLTVALILIGYFWYKNYLNKKSFYLSLQLLLSKGS